MYMYYYVFVAFKKILQFYKMQRQHY